MNLLQIQEPGTIQQEAQPKELAIGIDLGTTNSLVAFSKNSKPYVIENEILPSIVAIRGKEIKVGKLDENLTADFNIFSSFKRFMGKNGSGAVELSAHVLRKLKLIAEKNLGEEIKKAVITVPAYFDDAARNATKDAAKFAGLEVLRLINEPTAAALAYGLDKGAEGIYAVYDLGGGTFDISILKMQKGVFQVLATGGDTELGGDDFDYEIAKDYAAFIKTEVTPDILREARKIKEELTNSASVKRGNYKITKDKFESLISELVNRTGKICREVIFESKLEKNEIKGVVLVGGSTRVPLVKTMVEQVFGKKPLDDIDPDRVVALGAAIQAEALTFGSDNLLLDVTPLSLGLETYGGLVEKIIPRNTPIPIVKHQDFTTYQDGQNAMIIHVLQGERELVNQNRSLAKFELMGIPNMKAGVPKIRVTFIVDADGLLTVSAHELITGSEQKIEVKPTYGLSEDEIEHMLRESMENARTDIKQRLLLESRLEAEAVIKATREAMHIDADMLEKDEAININAAIDQLSKLAKQENRDEIDYAIQELKKASGNFAENRINKALKSAVAGKKIENF